MWQSSASRLWLCWAAADSPAPPAVVIVSGSVAVAAEHVLHLGRLVDDLVDGDAA